MGLLRETRRASGHSWVRSRGRHCFAELLFQAHRKENIEWRQTASTGGSTCLKHISPLLQQGPELHLVPIWRGHEAASVCRVTVPGPPEQVRDRVVPAIVGRPLIRQVLRHVMQHTDVVPLHSMHSCNVSKCVASCYSILLTLSGRRGWFESPGIKKMLPESCQHRRTCPFQERQSLAVRALRQRYIVRSNVSLSGGGMAHISVPGA